MKFLGFNKVLCLAPHPDDVEYSMGGTIIKHYDTQFDILCLTQGGDCDVTTGNSRLDEVRNSWESTGIINIDLFFTPNKLLKEKGSVKRPELLGELQSVVKTKPRGGVNRILAYYQGLLEKRGVLELRKKPD